MVAYYDTSPTSPFCTQAPGVAAYYDASLTLSIHWLSFAWESSVDGLVPPEALRSRKHLLLVCGRVAAALATINMRAVVDACARAVKERVKVGGWVQGGGGSEGV